MRPQILLLTLFLAVLPLSAVADKPWEPIKDVTDQHIQEIAQFAVTDFNRQNHTNLILKAVLGGKSQEEYAGTRYILDLAMTQPSSCYQTTVLEFSWLPHYELFYFGSAICQV
ncbi:cysteine proteinase inhibitor 5-like [Rhodamnia argentea]|uniref:Cysteine proteinase inhibitor 5-like n=1 Tax=Rhodamnia argentea TaxID=178133 RepID=A0ABM3HW15_9MYRT|nr:cysteine proteinase inhibitor 5-like [Rhodamnia argentea]